MMNRPSSTLALPTVAIGEALKEREAAEARERQGARTDIQENVLDVDFGQTRDKVGEAEGCRDKQPTDCEWW